MPKKQVVKEWEKDGVQYSITYTDWETEMVPNHYCGYATLKGYLEDYDDQIDVHGGITWCEQETDERWCYGFDCAHGGDENRPHTKDIDWLTKECERMGEQIVAKLAEQELKGKVFVVESQYRSIWISPYLPFASFDAVKRHLLHIEWESDTFTQKDIFLDGKDHLGVEYRLSLQTILK